MASDMVERIARAIFSGAVGESHWDNEFYREEREGCFRSARAAIEAMREPTQDMVDEVASDSPHADMWGGTDRQVRERWAAMPEIADRDDMSVFVEDGEVGISFGDFVTALGIWSFMHRAGDPPGTRPCTVREAADTFSVTDEVIRRAVERHYWMFLTGPDDDPTKQLIEHDGE